jgi:hypothetical protein
MPAAAITPASEAQVLLSCGAGDIRRSQRIVYDASVDNYPASLEVLC